MKTSWQVQKKVGPRWLPVVEDCESELTAEINMEIHQQNNPDQKYRVKEVRLEDEEGNDWGLKTT